MTAGFTVGMTLAWKRILEDTYPRLFSTSYNQETFVANHLGWHTTNWELQAVLFLSKIKMEMVF
jgi:hypothetical protein